MTSAGHRALVQDLSRVSDMPKAVDDLRRWMSFQPHIEFLRRQQRANELVLYASERNTFFHTVTIPIPIDDNWAAKELMEWHFNPYRPRCSVVSTMDDPPRVWVSEGFDPFTEAAFSGGFQLVFARDFDGERELSKWEIRQELVHLLDLHNFPSRNAYCRIGRKGDLDDIISISTDSDRTIISIDRESFDQFCLLYGHIGVQMFDFVCMKGGPGFAGDFEHRQGKIGDIGYFRGGIQESNSFFRGYCLIRPQKAPDERLIAHPWHIDESDERQKAEITFIIQDWRNSRLSTVSAAGDQTTNYFEANSNALPFDVSPVFFKPEVLQKYKLDREKYRFHGRTLSCRGAWYLQSFDINSEGQVFTYIYMLRRLPPEELRHWQAHNEAPKATISRRAIDSDFLGRISSQADSLSALCAFLEDWLYKGGSDVYRVIERHLIRAITPPFTDSKDEWAQSIDMLYKITVEALSTKAARDLLSRRGVAFENDWRSVKLLEQVVQKDSGAETRFEHLRSCIDHRNWLWGHSAPEKARLAAIAARTNFGSFYNHFESLCSGILAELRLVRNSSDISNEPHLQADLEIKIMLGDVKDDNQS